MLTYTDPVSGFTWKQVVKAARLVTPNYHGLPPEIGNIAFKALDGYPRHPLQEVWPNLTVLHYAMEIPERFQVTAPNGKKGVAFWLDNRNAGPSVSVTSENGRSNVAPLNWTGADARAASYWEYRTIIEDGTPYIWTNARGHGFTGLGLGTDWLDGTPTSGIHMYDRERGMTAQSVFTPVFDQTGTARQTLSEQDMLGTYSIMLYFPRAQAVATARKLAQFNELIYKSEAAQYAHPVRRSAERGALRSFSAEPMLEMAMAKGIEPEFEVSHGFEMTQHVIAPPLIPNFWQDAPSAVIVCWPVSEQQFAVLSRPNVPEGRRGFGY